MNKIKAEHFALLYKITSNNNSDIVANIAHELQRGELYCNLLKYFTKSCLKNLDETVFSHKKNCTRTITNMLASWFFTLYQTYDFSDDAFFPNNYLENDIILVRTLTDYCSLIVIPDLSNKINNIINDLHYGYSMLLNTLLSLDPTKFSSSNLCVIKTEVSHERNGNTILFYNMVLHNNTIHMCTKLHNIITNIMIPVYQYNMMKQRYIHIHTHTNTDTDVNINMDTMDTLIWIILFRYQLLSSNNNQLAVTPTIYKRMKHDFNLSVECFASAINTSSSYYCSLYYDIEQYFGSIGNFFNIVPLSGTYSFNPPYQYDVISNGIKRIIQHMDHSDQQLNFIITIPIWDNTGKTIMADNSMANNNNIIQYNDFTIMTDIRNSKYFRGLRMISKDDFTYMDHNFHLFKNKTIQNTYVIVMSNKECNYIDIINTYDFYTY